MSVGSVLKGILKIVATGASVAIPGAAPVIGAVETAVADKGSEQSIEQAVLAGLDELEELKPATIKDPATFNANIQIAHDAILRAIAAVGTAPGAQPLAQPASTSAAPGPVTGTSAS